MNVNSDFHNSKEKGHSPLEKTNYKPITLFKYSSELLSRFENGLCKVLTYFLMKCIYGTFYNYRYQYTFFYHDFYIGQAYLLIWS